MKMQIQESRRMLLALTLLCGSFLQLKANDHDQFVVTLHIFSGRQDPTFIINDRETVGRINASIQSINYEVQDSASRAMIQPYRGIEIRALHNADIPERSLRVSGGIAREFSLVGEVAIWELPDGLALEKTIMEIALERGIITAYELDVVREMMAGSGSSGREKTAGHHSAPNFTPPRP